MSTTETARTAQTELAIGGMTCASCAARIEKKLNRMDGVEATVNYATEKAKVTYNGDDVAVADLIATVEATGYTAKEPAPPVTEPGGGAAGGADGEDADAAALRPLRERLITAVVLSVPVIAMAMVPALQFEYWQWLSLTLAAPVVTYAAWPFHKAAVTNARHGAATMDTLISVGTSAAFLWSLWALFLGSAGTPGMTHAFELTIERSDGAANIYLEAAAGVTAFILAGRYFEARSKRKAGAALKALLELGAKDVTVVRDGREETVPVSELKAGDHFLVRPGEKIATDGIVDEGTSAVKAIPVVAFATPFDSERGRRTTTRAQPGATTRPRRRSLRSRPRGCRRPRALRWQPSARVQGLEPRGANGARRESAVPEPCLRRRRAVVAARAVLRPGRRGAGWPRCRTAAP